MKRSKRKPCPKRKSYRTKGEVTMNSCPIRGEDEASIPASIATIKVANLLSELDSMAAARIWELGKELGGIFTGVESGMTDHIKEIETRDHTAWEKLNQVKPE
ncbi:hypothetical protein Ancab_023636, partial [Ancistrocladus abbreviatus]